MDNTSNNQFTLIEAVCLFNAYVKAQRDKLIVKKDGQPLTLKDGQTIPYFQVGDTGRVIGITNINQRIELEVMMDDNEIYTLPKPEFSAAFMEI